MYYLQVDTTVFYNLNWIVGPVVLDRHTDSVPSVFGDSFVQYQILYFEKRMFDSNPIASPPYHTHTPHPSPVLRPSSPNYNGYTEH